MIYLDIRDQLTHEERALAYNVWDTYTQPGATAGSLFFTPISTLASDCEFAARAVTGKKRGQYKALAERLRKMVVASGVR